MSELKRFQRLAKSLIPRFPRGRERHYTLEDARMMINELGMQMPPEALAYLLDSDERLDDFLNAIYNLEEKFRRKVVTPQATIDEALDPKVYVEAGTIAFTVKGKRGEVIFAEYDWAGA
ncbi:MAG: hypothetical protein D6730_13835 [Bacteroidetes bacterium]|nr:MAG: hypothetical protein D6730_13835 [Bacteroidota bacterium]